MKVRLALLVGLAAAVTLAFPPFELDCRSRWSTRCVSVAAAGPNAAKQRVAIETKILPQGTFVLTPLQAGALKRDSGTISGNWQTAPGRDVMRDGQKVGIYRTPGRSPESAEPSRFESESSGSPSGTTTKLPSAPGRWCAGQGSTPGSPGAGGVGMRASVSRGTRASRASSPFRSAPTRQSVLRTAPSQGEKRTRLGPAQGCCSSATDLKGTGSIIGFRCPRIESTTSASPSSS